MGIRSSLRLIVALLAATVGLAAGAPAWAIATISINPGNVPTTAAGFATHECSANLGGGPFAGQDVWVFVLPQPNKLGTFVSLHLNFTTPGGEVQENITLVPASDRAIVNDMGTSKAWIRTPAGWTLHNNATTAVITAPGGTDPNDHFNLTATCPASSSPSPTASPTVKPTAPSPSAKPTASPTALPITGTSFDNPSFIAPVALGSALVLCGIALVILRRRSDGKARA